MMGSGEALDRDEAEPSAAVGSCASQIEGISSLVVVIVNYKTAGLTIRCLETLEPELETIPGSRVTVVENASGEGEILARAIRDRGWDDWVSLDVVEHNGGFSFGNNRGIEPALRSDPPARYILLLNADTEVRPRALRALIDFMDQNPVVGIAGSSFENLDGSDWRLAFRFPSLRSEMVSTFRFGPLTRLFSNKVVTRSMEQDRPQPVDWVAGACMIVRREVFDAAGLMDEKYFLYYEEVDFCLQARRQGWPCWYVPQSRVMHIGGQSTGLTERDKRPKRTPAYWFASRRRYFQKNYGILTAMAADLLYGIGFATWRLRVRLFKLDDPDDPPHHLADFWRHSIFFNWRAGA